MTVRGGRLDAEVEKIAATLAQKNKFRHVSLRKVADESGIFIIEVSRILSESKIGEIETYDTDTLEDDVFILDIPEWLIEIRFDKQPNKSQITKANLNSQQSKGNIDQEKERSGDWSIPDINSPPI